MTRRRPYPPPPRSGDAIGCVILYIAAVVVGLVWVWPGVRLVMDAPLYLLGVAVGVR